MGTAVMGRPTKYNAEIAAKLIDELSTTTDGFEVICQRNGVVPATGWNWLNANPDFFEKYTIARGAQTEMGYDELRKITDAPLPETDVYDMLGNFLGRKVDPGAAMAEMQRRKLQVDVIKFKLVKLQPKRFGERSQVDIDVKVRREVSPEQMLELRNTILQKTITAPEFEDAEEVLDDESRTTIQDFDGLDEEDDGSGLW